MNTVERMNAVIEYIECHLTEKIDMKHLAGLVYCSIHTFQRLFSYISRTSIMEYIRNRRLTAAALELQQSDVKIIDLAMKYGYESPVSFARAFQAIHGISPSQARKSNVTLKAFPKMTFQITVEGASAMNYRIVKTEAFKVFGEERIISTAGDPKYYPHEGAVWGEINGGDPATNKYNILSRAVGEAKPPFSDAVFVRDDMCRIHEMWNYNNIDDTTYGYMLFGFVTPESKTDGYKVIEIPAATWIIFASDMQGWNVGETMGGLIQNSIEWLSSSNYKKVDSPELGVYGGSLENGYLEYWMPITKKS